MYEIFQKLLEERGVKPADITKATGISSSTFTDWKNGRSKPKSDKLQLIADYFGVTLDYLMNGDRIENEFNSLQAELDLKISQDLELKSAIEKYYSLSDNKRKHVIELIELLAVEDSDD